MYDTLEVDLKYPNALVIDIIRDHYYALTSSQSLNTNEYWYNFRVILTEQLVERFVEESNIIEEGN